VTDAAGRRGFVKFAVGRRLTLRRACELAGASRSWLRYRSRRCDDRLVKRLKDLALKHPRFGSRRLHVMLRREGHVVNLKRVRRLCRLHGLTLPARRRRKRRGIGVGMPCRAERPHHVWAYDFVEDRTSDGRKLRILTVEDEFTRVCLAIEVAHRMNARFVCRVLLGLFAEHGTPQFVRSDNGPEFIARALMRMLDVHGVQARHIEPGSPWQNGYNERFNGSLRDECLNLETFHTAAQACVIARSYKRYYNQARPHSALGYRTPEEFADAWAKEQRESKRKTKKKDGCAGGKRLRLAHCASSGRGGKRKRAGGSEKRPARRPSDGPRGAPVARQQSRILRVDESEINKRRAGREVPGRQKESLK
jgi:putative transposase